MIERLTLPIRLILLPKDFDKQLKGHHGLLLKGKFLAFTLALIAIAILLIAPIGYQHTVQALYAMVGSIEIFNDMRLQSVFFGLLAFILGAVISYYMSRAVSGPINDL